MTSTHYYKGSEIGNDVGRWHRSSNVYLSHRYDTYNTSNAPELYILGLAPRAWTHIPIDPWRIASLISSSQRLSPSFVFEDMLRIVVTLRMSGVSTPMLFLEVTAAIRKS